MASLESCIKKLGKALDQRDIDTIRARIVGGMPEESAVEAHLGALLDAPISSPGMWPVAMQVARDYAESVGIAYTPPLEYAPPINVDLSQAIAREFELMEHNPKDPLVKAAYKAMIDETLAQFEFILKTGLKIEFIRGADPYEKPSDVIDDVRKRNHMWVFPTEAGFGSGDKFSGNPLEAKTKYVIDGHELLANDVFRIVHDYFGHVAPGAQFRARGEETAYQAHAAMFSPLARRALAVETRGQNSWLNYGPYGETNRTAKTEDTIFADQEIGLLPIWASEEGRQSAYERSARFQRARQANRTGYEGAIDAAGRVELVHYSEHELERIDPSRWGQGLSRFVRSETNRRLSGAPGRAYFGIESAQEGPYRKESGLGERRLVTHVPGELIYNLQDDPENLWDSSDVVASELAIRDAGYMGYMRAHPELGKVVALYDEVAVKPAAIVLAQSPLKGTTTIGEFEAKSFKDGTMIVYGDPLVIRQKLPEGVKGTPVPGGLRFTPNMSHRAAASIRGDRITYSRGGKVVAHRIKNGKYVGASAANNTAAKLKKWRETFKQLAMEGEHGRFWYELSGSAIYNMVGGNVEEAKKFIALLAIYSPQAKVDANSTFALRAWAQYKAGLPIEVKTGDLDGKASRILYGGEQWQGQKTNNFYENLLAEVDGAASQGATIDLWMMRAGFYDHDAPNDSEYAFMENEVNRLAQELGWGPHQVQAAIWVALKARMENPKVKKDTEALSFKRKWIRYDTNAKGQKVRVVLDEAKHSANWLKHAMDHSVTPADINEAKFDFSDGVRRHIGQISWEAAPSVSSGYLPGYHSASPELQESFQLAIKDALSDENGGDLLAQYLGILADGSVIAPGVWEGVVTPGTQVSVAMAPAGAGVMYHKIEEPISRADWEALNIPDDEKGQWVQLPGAKPEKAMFAKKTGEVITTREWKTGLSEPKNYVPIPAIDPGQKKILDLYAATLGLILRQDGVGYHKPFFNEAIMRSNAMDITLGRSLTNEEMVNFSRVLRTKLSSEVPLISTGEGVRVVNFDVSVDNKQFHKLVEQSFDEAISDDVKYHIGYFASDGNMMMNDWRGATNGEMYQQAIIAEGRPDLLRWSADVLYPKVQAVHREYAEKYGWGETPDIQFQTEKVVHAQLDNLGFYSQVTRTLETLNLPQWNKDQPAPGIEIWNKLSKSPGVKAEETKWIGIEEYLTMGGEITSSRQEPQTKFTRDEVLNFVRRNGVQVVEIYADKEESADGDVIMWGTPELTQGGQSVFTVSSQDFSNGSELVITKLGSGRFTVVHQRRGEIIADVNPDDWIASLSEAQVKAESYARAKGLITNYDDSQVAKWGSSQYLMGGPKENYREVKLTLPEVPGTFVETNHFDDRNIVAWMRVTDRRLLAGKTLKNLSITIEDNPTESLVYPKLLVVKDVDTGKVLSTTPLRSTTNANTILEKAREVYNSPNSSVQYDTRTDTFFIDEFQSDWHQQGRKRGYRQGLDQEQLVMLGDDIAELYNSVSSELSKIFDSLIDPDGPTDRIEIIHPATFGNAFTQGTEFTRTNFIRDMWEYIATGDVVGYMEQNRLAIIEVLKKHVSADVYEKLKSDIKRNDELVFQQEAEKYGTPDAPFKNDAWMSLALKRALVLAVNQGKDALAWPNSEVLTDRWSEDYRTLYENTYDRKMVSIVKKLTGQTPIQLDRETGNPFVVDAKREKIDEALRESGSYTFERGNVLKVLDDGSVDYLNDAGSHITSFESIQDALDTVASIRPSQGYWIIQLPEDLKKKILTEGFQLFQPNRGQIEIDPTTNERLIRLGEQSDLSTFLHESAHLFLEVGKELSQKFGIRPHIEALFDWLGVTDWSQIGIEQHEKFAETFEVYLQSGEAPSLGLRKAFAAFRDWLVAVYKAFDPRRRANLTPEIKDYFDRMLATDAEIARARGNPAYDELFRSQAQAGMTDAEWAKYQERVQRAKDKATRTLDEKLVGELRRRKTAEWKSEKEPLVEQEKERLRGERQYQILTDLPDAPMDYDAVVSIMGKLPGNMIGKTKKGGIDPAEYAELHGYPNAKAMLTDIAATPALNKMADDAAEAIMVAKHGDILNDGSIEEEARQAMHNDEQAKLMLMELRALDKKTKVDIEYLKSEARRLIGTMTYKQIKPNRYYTAEVRAARKAATATSPAEKAAAKAQQLANHYLYREAVDTQKRMERHRAKVRAVQTRKYSERQVDPETIMNMKLLANTYEMRKGKNRSDNLVKLVSWFDSQLSEENEFAQMDMVDPLIAKMIADKRAGLPVTDTLPEFDEMTADELNALVNQLDHMRFIGGKRSEDAKADLLVDRETVAQVVRDNAVKTIPPRHQAGRFTRAKDLAVQFIASHHRLASLFDRLSGYQPSALDAEMARVTDASNAQIKLQLEMAKLLDEAFRGSQKELSGRQKATITKQDGQPWELTTQARLVLALNWGTEGNREVLLEGLNNNFPDTYTADDVVKMLEGMTTQELQTVNAIWAATESMWPAIQGVTVRMTGVSPTKLDPTPFTINGTTMTGGHYKLVYERAPADSSRMNLSVEGESMNRLLDMNPAGSTIERVGSGGRQVSLEIKHLFNTVAENVHYVAYAELAQRLKSLFTGNKNPVTEAIIRHQGQPWFDNLINTFEGIVDPNVEAATPWWAAARAIRTNLTFAYLALSVRNVVQQPLAITNAFAQLGAYWTGVGLWNFYSGNPFAQAASIRERSVFMAHRLQLMNRESREQLTKISSVHPAVGKAKTMAFAPQSLADALAAYPVWMGAESKYRKENPLATEEEIVRHADMMVQKTIGSGAAKDVGSIFNANEAMKQITFMGTFFNLTFNLHVENYNRMKLDQISKLEYARRLAWMAVVPAIMTAVVTDDWDEDEDFWDLLWKVMGYNMAAVFGVREMFSALDGFQPSMPAMQVFKGLAGMVGTIEGLMSGEKEFDLNTVTKTLRNLQPIIPIPTQIPRIIEGLNDDNQDWWGTLVEGKERNKQ